MVIIAEFIYCHSSWLKSVEGIARVFYCTLVGRRIVMLHSFIKKKQKTPPNERRIAETRLKEIKNANS
jgi:phage-related protein